MSGLPPLGVVNLTRERTDRHAYAEWCFCKACAQGALWRGIAWLAMSLALAAFAIWMLVHASMDLVTP